MSISNFTRNRHTSPSKKLPWFRQPWLHAILVALFVHVGMLWVPIAEPAMQQQQPRVVRVMLQAPKPRPKPRVRPKPRKIEPPPRRRRVRRKRRRRKVRRRRRKVRKIQKKRPKMRRTSAKSIIPPAPPVVREPVRPAPRRVDPPPPIPRRVTPAPPPRRVSLRGYGISVYHSIQRQKRYPLMAYRMRFEGLVILKVTIKRNGHLHRRPRVVRSSGHGILDKEAVRMVIAAAPLRPMPQGYSRPYAAFNIPINFKIQ